MAPLTLGVQYGLVHSYTGLATYASVARKHNVDPRTAARYIKLHNSMGQLPTKRSRNRKSKVSAGAAMLAAELLLSGEYSSSAEVAAELHKRGATDKLLHRTTVVRHARLASCKQGFALEVEVGKPKKGVSARNKTVRETFCNDNKDRVWDNVMITDRKKFLFHHPGTSVKPVRWKKRGEKAAAYTVNRPMAVNVYMGLTKFGVTKSHMVAGTSNMKTKHKNKKGKTARNITASEYEEVVSKTLLPEGNRIFSSQGITQWVLQQDNDPTHIAAEQAVAKFNGKHTTTVSLLPKWPANSPDLSPIENLWAIVDKKVQAAGCKNFEEFQKKVVSELAGVSKKLSSKLMRGMHTRLSDCLALKGDRIGK